MKISPNIKLAVAMSLAALLIAPTFTKAANQEPEKQDSLWLKTVNQIYTSRPAWQVGSSVSSLDGQKVAHNSVLSLGNVLYGTIAGLHAKQGDGELGSDYPTLYIRGQHTISGSNSPLVLVDGFPRDYNTMNVDEIESISVLKDAASTALYGMDGANGVILITTKRGVSGGVKIGFKAEAGFMQPTRLPQFYGSYDYASFYNMAQRNDGKSVLTYSDEKLEGYKNKVDNILYPDVDWIDQTIRQAAPMQNYMIDFRGGNSVARYYLTMGYTGAEGLFKESANKTYDANNKLSRINFRSNLDINITKSLSMKLDLSGRLENLNSPYNSSNAIWQNLYTFHPNAAPVYVADGVWGGTNTYGNNPVAYINDAGYRHTHRRTLQSNLQLNYDFSKWVKGLNAGVRASYDSHYSVQNGYSKTFAVREALAYDPTTQSYILSDEYGINSKLTAFGPSDESEIRSNTIEAYLTHDYLSGAHRLNTLIVCHQDSYMISSNKSFVPDRRMFASGQLSYSYDNRYLVDLSASYGGGENFMKGKRFGWFPAAALSWVISNEKGLKGSSALSLLKLRVSSGLVGNQNVGGTQFAYRNLYSSYGSGWGVGVNNGSTGNGYAESAFGNENLTWEKALKTDVGLDMSLWNKLHLSLTGFYEYRYDILSSGSALTPTFLGSNFGYINYSRVASSGAEAVVALTHTTKEWNVDMAINASYVKNKILRYSETTKNYSYLSAIGRPIGQRFILVWEGYYSPDDVENRTVNQSFGTVIPGSLKYTDINNDGTVDSNDYQPIGKSSDVPEVELGFNFNVGYKGLYVTGNIQACLGRDINLRGAAPYASSPLYYDRNMSTYFKQPWTAEVAADPTKAGQTDLPSLTIENAANNFQNSTFFMRNGNFARLRMLEVGYTLPQRWSKAIAMQSCSIYLRGQNLFTLDHLDGQFDPEVLEGYPVLKSYNIGVNITF